MTDRDLEGLPYLGGAPMPETPECFDDEVIAALAEGALDSAARAALLPHLAACPRCRRAVASVAQALAEPSLAREVDAGASRRRLIRIALPAAAAAVLLVVFAWPRFDEGGGHRGPTPTVAVPMPIAPIGVVAGASSLQWSTVAGADHYRVTLSGVNGPVLYEIEVADSVVALPDSVVLEPGRTYVWMVEARIGFDRWSTSKLVEFSIGGGVSR